MALQETAVFQMLVDPEVRAIAGSSLREWMFEDENLKLAFRVLMDGGYGNHRPDPQTFALEMYKFSSVTEDDAASVVKFVRSAPAYDEEGVVRATRTLEDFIREKMIASCVSQMTKNGVTVPTRQAMADALSFSLGNVQEFFDYTNIEQIRAAQEESLPAGTKIIKSYFDLVNSNAVYGGYKYGDLITIAGETGLGKTTSAICEGANAINQGFRVFHVVMGDMTDFDIFIAYLSFWSGQLVEKLIYDWEEYYTPEIQEKFKNLRSRAFPADFIDIYQYEAKAMALYKEWEFDVAIVDYDGNFKATTADSMYAEGGAIYNGLKRFAKGRCAMIVLSQVKIDYWGVEIGDKGCLAESSKKQHAIDFLLHIGKNKDCPRIGSITLAKVRRGRDSVTHRIKFRNAYSRIVEISGDEYENIKSEHKSGAGASSVGGFDLS